MTTQKLSDVLQSEFPSGKAVIVVAGPWNAGKTTFINAVSERAWPELEVAFRNGTKCAPMGIGEITIDDNTALVLLENPGSLMWEVIFKDENISERVFGVIVLCDSTAPENFTLVRSIVEYCQGSSQRFVVVANKRDLPDAWDIEDVRIALRIEERTKLLPCSATVRESVKLALLEFLAMIPNEPLLNLIVGKIHRL